MCCAIGVQQQLQEFAMYVATLAGRKACAAKRIAWRATRRVGRSYRALSRSTIAGVLRAGYAVWSGQVDAKPIYRFFGEAVKWAFT